MIDGMEVFSNIRVFSANEDLPAVVRYAAGQPSTVEVEVAGQVFCGLGEDAFEALADVRERLEAGGLQIGCQGARKDVWPSGMCRQMAGGRRAYICPPSSRADLIDIFKPAAREKVTTVAAQRDSVSQIQAAHIRAKAFARPHEFRISPPSPAPALLTKRGLQPAERPWVRADVPPALAAQAKAHPHEFVYEIDAVHQASRQVPLEAVRGAWVVNGYGEIVGDFIANPDYSPNDGSASSSVVYAYRDTAPERRSRRWLRRASRPNRQ